MPIVFFRWASTTSRWAIRDVFRTNVETAKQMWKASFEQLEMWKQFECEQRACCVGHSKQAPKVSLIAHFLLWQRSCGWLDIEIEFFFSTWNKDQLEIRGTGKNWGLILDSMQFKHPFACFRYQTGAAIFKMSWVIFNITRLQLEVQAEPLKCGVMRF